MGHLESQGHTIFEGRTKLKEIAEVVASIHNKIQGLWHRRLGHKNWNGLQQLKKQGLINSKQLKDLELGENCVLGKTHRLSFKAAIHRTKVTLDYIHSNL